MRRRRMALPVAAALAAALAAAPVGSAEPAPEPEQKPIAPAAPVEPPAVAVEQRGELLGADWQASGDRLWTTGGDANGFHVLVAEAKTGYTWRTAATLRKPGLEADAWVGNACVTGSGTKAVVVYAPRAFTNDEELFARGGFSAVVDLVSGEVTDLPVRTTLAYYNPGCGLGEERAARGARPPPSTRRAPPSAPRAPAARRGYRSGGTRRARSPRCRCCPAARGATCSRSTRAASRWATRSPRTAAPTR